MEVKSLYSLLAIVSSLVKRNYKYTQKDDNFTLIRDGEEIQNNLNLDQCAHVVIGMYIVARELKGGQSCKD